MLTLVQDLDNFVFQNDVVAVISAGNSPPGIQPASAYPAHFDDPRWSLGSWARSFNSLTCGSIVGKLSAAGLAQQIGWPSPFSRVGPGLCNSPKPDFVEIGGNTDSTYNYAPGLGVWGLTDTGFWEDRCGTSYAAPILCRQVADAFLKLDTVCEKGARPYGVTAKAFLFLTSVDPPNSDTLGPDPVGRWDLDSLARIDSGTLSLIRLFSSGRACLKIVTMSLGYKSLYQEIGWRMQQTTFKTRCRLGPASERGDNKFVGY